MATATSDLLHSETGAWELVIGLEVHAQIISKSKLFSGAATAFGAEPNTQVSFLDAAFPGMLPVINHFCVEQAIKTGLGLHGHINLTSVFDRKNYFYADLPLGYQISQFNLPIMEKGFLDIEKAEGTRKRIHITRLHMEQDAGKSLHDLHPTQSYIDLNRAGVALMEIVSEPDIRSAEEAATYVKKLRSLLRTLETCDGNMEEGSLRVDVNVSVRRPGGPLGTRTEIKNVNSVRFIQQAVHFEASRQIQEIEAGREIVQETRLFDANKGETRSMRNKEEAHDYRYFPDPDLLPLRLDAEEIERMRQNLPELPDAKTARFIQQFDLSPYDASVLVAEKETAFFFESAVAASRHTDKETAKRIANWMTGDFFAALNRSSLDLEHAPVTSKSLAALVDLIVDGTISGKMAKEVFLEMWETKEDPQKIIQDKGLQQMSDGGELERIIQEILVVEADKVADYKSGKNKLFGFFVGQVMKATKGQGNPALINELLKKAL